VSFVGVVDDWEEHLMRVQPIFALQPLESRRLLHAGHPGIGPAGILEECPEVVEARAAVQDAVEQLNADQRAGRRTIKADRMAIVEEMKQLADEIGAEGIKDALAPLKEKLHADTKAKNKEFRAAREELRIAKRKGRQLIAADIEALRDAKESGDQAAIDAAEEKLAADKAQIEADLKPIRDGIIALGEKWRPILTADHEAIESKLEELNPDLIPLFDKLDDDIAAVQAKLDAAHAAVTSAHGELRTAIADCLETHATDDVA
jgi:hypothetical protein